MKKEQYIPSSEEETSEEEKKFNINLMQSLPKQTQDNMTSNWDIPEGMDVERINESKENQINFLLSMAKDKLESDDQKTQAEAGRILNYLRQEFDDPKEFSNSEAMKRLQSDVEGTWLDRGGEKANEIYKSEYLDDPEKNKQTESKPLEDVKFSEQAQKAQEQIKQLEQQGVETNFNLKDLIKNNIDRVEDFCNQQSSEIEQFATNSEDLGILTENSTKGIQMISRMLKRVTTNPNFKNLADRCQDEMITKIPILKNIDKELLNNFNNVDEAEEYLNILVKENEKIIENLNEVKEKIIKQTKKVFEEIATVANALHDSYKNANERGKKHLEPFVNKFEGLLNTNFQISKINLTIGEKIDYEFTNISAVEEIDKSELNETIFNVEKEGYRFNPKFSHNKEQGDILSNPRVTAYKYKK